MVPGIDTVDEVMTGKIDDVVGLVVGTLTVLEDERDEVVGTVVEWLGLDELGETEADKPDELALEAEELDELRLDEAEDINEFRLDRAEEPNELKLDEAELEEELKEDRVDVA